MKWNNSFLDYLLWKLKSFWINSSIRKASAVTVQTEALKNKIIEKTKVAKDKLMVIPHGLGLLQLSSDTKKWDNKTSWRIGYITKFGVQKDFNSAFIAVSLLKKLGVNIKLVLTLNPETKEFPYLLEEIRRYNIEDLIENHGEVSCPKVINEIYQSLDIFIFPSLCESFGFTLLEAMAMGLPVIVANTTSNLEIVDSAGKIFCCENGLDLHEKILELINKEEEYKSAVQRSLDRAQDFCWKKTAQKTLDLLHKMHGRS